MRYRISSEHPPFGEMIYGNKSLLFQQATLPISMNFVLQVQALVESQLKNMLVRHFEPSKADAAIFDGEGETPAWLAQMIDHPAWRKFFKVPKIVGSIIESREPRSDSNSWTEVASDGEPILLKTEDFSGERRSNTELAPQHSWKFP